MRIAIHIMGLAATLLFALTVIAWVDGVEIFQKEARDIWGGISVPKYRFAIYSGQGELFLSCNAADPARVEFEFYRASYQPPYLGDEPIPLESFGPIEYSTEGHSLGVIPNIKLAIPYWLIVLILTIPTFAYFYFLRKRKRHPSVDDYSASSDDSDASGLAGSSEESVSQTS